MDIVLILVIIVLLLGELKQRNCTVTLNRSHMGKS